jgi:hypothetical protein
MHDLGGVTARVPWAHSLVQNAALNWPKILRFLVEEDNLSEVSVNSDILVFQI